jgi:tripartite-type tricarboxylate transporter receptor subunit TctC
MKAMQGLRVWVIMLLLGAVGASCPTPSVAGEASPIPKPAGYPSRPVEFIVPFDPGGGADASQRVFDKYAEPLVGQRLVIVNKPGAGGATGWAELVRAKPDGYTLAILTPPFNIIPALVRPKQTGYKLDQFTNICVYAIVPDLLYAREGGQFKTLKDVVEYAKQNPDKIKAANTGTLGADFMTTLLIEHATGTAFTQIPFTGGAQALQATLAGTTDVMVGSSLYALAQKGKLRPLAIATEQRDPEIPDVPTFKELGYNVVSERYRALGGPPGLPGEIVTYWGQVCRQVVDTPQFRAEMSKIGQPAGYRGPADAQKGIDQMTRDMEGLVEKYKLAK